MSDYDEHAGDDALPTNMSSSFKGPPSGASRTQDIQTGNNPYGHQTIQDSHGSNPDQNLTNSSSSICHLSEDFERLSTHLRDNDTHEDQVLMNPDRPEISLQIRSVEQALLNLTTGNAASEIAPQLSQLVPKILKLERKAKMQTTLRGIFEEQVQEYKTQTDKLTEKLHNAREENQKLVDDVAELKRAKEDEHLRGFDVVTKKEANEIKDVEKKEAGKQQKLQSATGVDEEAYFLLQRKYTSLKKQTEEIVKVNHAWDEHYHNMKSQLEERIKDQQKQTDDARSETIRVMKEFQEGENKAQDDILVQAKMRIDQAEKERDDALADVAVLKQKCEKVERYARTLTSQRNEMEAEIKRLNEALAEKITKATGEGASAKIHQAPPEAPQHVAAVASSLLDTLSESLEAYTARKRVNDMTEEEMKEEIELLRQQTELFQSDFVHERQDRQRVIGELDVVQKELRRAKRMLKFQRDDEMAYGDAQYALQLQRGQKLERPYSASAPVRDYGHYVYSRPPPQHPVNRPYYQHETSRLIAHGRGRRPFNVGGNDMFIDGADLDADGAPTVDTDIVELSDDSNTPRRDLDDTRICPRCKRTFNNDPDYHVHINVCLDN